MHILSTVPSHEAGFRAAGSRAVSWEIRKEIRIFPLYPHKTVDVVDNISTQEAVTFDRTYGLDRLELRAFANALQIRLQTGLMT